MPYKSTEKQREYQRNWYKKNKDKHNRRIRERRVVEQDKFYSWKETLSCSVCGYNKCVSALEFHHPDPAEKDSSVGALGRWNFDAAVDEASKCVVLCSNCHKELHHNLRN